MSVGVRAAVDSVPAEPERRETVAGFDEAFTLHHRAVFSMARAVVRDSALAEEVTQEVFLKLYRHLDSAPRANLLRPWLLRVTLNEARNAIRSRNRALARENSRPNSNLKVASSSRERRAPWIKSKNRCEVVCCYDTRASHIARSHKRFR